MERERKRILHVRRMKSNLTVNELGERSEYGSLCLIRKSMKQIINEISEKRSTYSRSLLNAVASEISEMILEQLREGFEVEVLGLGTIQPTMKGSLSRMAKKSDMAKMIKVGFTPSRAAKAAVSGFILIDDVKSNGQCISYVVSAEDEENESNFEKGSFLRVKGIGLKLGGEDAGVFLERECESIKCIVLDNTYKKSLVKLPKEAEAGEWRLAWRTRLSASGRELKQCVEFFSKPFSVY